MQTDNFFDVCEILVCGFRRFATTLSRILERKRRVGNGLEGVISDY